MNRPRRFNAIDTSSVFGMRSSGNSAQNRVVEKVTMAKDADDQGQTKERIRWQRSMLGALIWKVMPKKCVERYCESAKKDVSPLQRWATLCVDDHHVPAADYETSGGLSAACSPIVPNCV